MRIIDLIKMGLRNLFRRKARTILTIVGVVIGTVSIVVMISVGIGMNKSFESSVLENGSMTIITVQANNYEWNENDDVSVTKQTLNSEVIEQLKNIEHVKCVTPFLNASAQFYSGKYESWANLIVMDMSCYEDFGFPALEDGTYPTKEDAKDALYFGSESVNDFYYWSGNRPMTKQLDLDKDKLSLKFTQYQPKGKKEFEYKVVNRRRIAAPESGYSEANWSIFMDFDMYKDLFTKYSRTLKGEDRKRALDSLDKFDQIRINVDNMNNVTAVQDELEKMGFKSYSDMEYIAPMQETAKMLEMILGAIGAVAMLVSAINIANTMIMSIYERTREIGIMKVLGCRVADIRKLFLFEAGMIGLIGGLIGIGLSYIGSWALNKYGADILGSIMNGGYGGTASAVSVIPLWLPLFGAAFAMMVGIVSGFIPAVKATKISAIEAMKANE
ncbi:MAG: FtsX-like permease family protein [Lachnospiraceae bacterium]|nr:FtsX-like permease family protein [Lachnospiraceae bacterium]